jgi:hypothetical protein
MTLTARSSSAMTMTNVNSLSSSSGLTVGACTDAYDNSSNLDEMLSASGVIKVASSGLSAGNIEVWAFAERADGTWPVLFTAGYSGSVGGFTVVSRNVLAAGAVLIRSMVTTTTASVEYNFRPADLSAMLGGTIRKVAFFVVHNTGAALASSGQAISVKPHYWA